ncbi:MAG: molybdopterin cofactor-binding domain-containing protein [Dehalococcoidales bacterium]
MVDEFGPDLYVIGKRNLDPQGENIVTGRYDFPEDRNMPGKLYARILGSPHAHAKILSIDTSRAEALEGVKATVTAEALGGELTRWSDTMLCVEQEVAAVAAVDEATAERALDLIDVEYEVLPHVIDVEEAMLSNSNNSGAFPDSNFNPSPRAIDRGDVAAGFAEAETTIDETVGWLRRHTHNEIEPDSALSWWENDEVYCWSTNQNTFSKRRGMSSAMGMKYNQIHVTTHGTGGGFGGKGGSYPEIVAAELSRKTGKPVALRLPRRQYTVLRSHQYGVKLQMKMGAKNDGTLTAVESTWWGNGGRNGGRSSWADPDASTWKVPNYKTLQEGIATNVGQSGAWRCVAHPEGQFLSDLVLEKMAATLNINPLEFRRKIFVTEDMPYQDNGRPMDSFGVRRCLDKAAAASGYMAKYHAPGARTLPDGRMHGIGIHAHSDGHGSVTSSNRGSIINMCRDGSFLFNSGGTRVMGGPATIAQIIAETIGVKYEDVHVGSWGITDIASDGGSQGGSTHTGGHGGAALVSALDVRAQLFEEAAEELGVNPEDLDAREGVIFVVADPTQSITHADVKSGISHPIIGRGVHYGRGLRKPSPSVGDFPLGTRTQHKTGCAGACEVAVDTETGDVEILNFWSVIDAGRVIDRVTAEGQILAGLPVQFSQAMLFDDSYDPLTGRLLSFGHIDDKTCTSLDIPGPDKSHAVLLETINSVGAYGCQGIGEPCVSSWASITNAINNALGVQVTEGPYTPQVILKALGKA